jgi:hypothetical protein
MATAKEPKKSLISLGEPVKRESRFGSKGTHILEIKVEPHPFMGYLI